MFIPLLKMIIDIVGNKAGSLLFLSLKLNKKTLKNAIVDITNDEIIASRGPLSHHQYFEIMGSFVQDALVTVAHLDTLYVICPISKSIHYTVQKKNRAFHALHRLAIAAFSSSLSIEEICNLCRPCMLFSQNTKSCTQEWKAWWKMVLKLLGTWPSIAPISLTKAKWLGLVSRRTQTLPDSDVEEEEECEILYANHELGIMYNIENKKISYVSPMIVSQSAFRVGIRDVSNIICKHWVMLFLNKKHWLEYTLPFYVTTYHQRHVPQQIVSFLESNGFVSEKHNMICKDMKQLHKLLK